MALSHPFSAIWETQTEAKVIIRTLTITEAISALFMVYPLSFMRLIIDTFNIRIETDGLSKGKIGMNSKTRLGTGIVARDVVPLQAR
jgi:hypothetical protein